MTRVATSEVCVAVWHGTGWAYAKYRCRCPEAKVDRKSQWHVGYSRSTSGTPRGRHLKHRDVDPVAVGIALTGRALPALGAGDRELAVATLTAKGKSCVEIARLIGVAPRSVGRIRQRIRSAT